MKLTENELQTADNALCIAMEKYQENIAKLRRALTAKTSGEAVGYERLIAQFGIQINEAHALRRRIAEEEVEA